MPKRISMLSRTALPVIVTVLSAVFPRALGAQAYADAPPVLRKLVVDAATDVVNAGAEFAPWPDMVFYAVADALTLGREGGSVRHISPYRYYVETARTDRQLGASSGSSATTSLLEKPGIPALLGLAIEHGAIDQEVSGTGITLSTSPYSLFRLFNPETDQNFGAYDLWRRIGVSVTYGLDGGQDVQAGDLDSQEITEWSVRIRALGDRSARSTRSAELWEEKIQPLVQKRLNDLVSGLNLLGTDTVLASRSDSIQDNLLEAIDDYLSENVSTPSAQKIRAVTDMALAELGNGIFGPVRDGRITIDPAIMEQIVNEVIPTLQATHEELELARIEASVEEIAETVNKAPLLTLAYTHHRDIPGVMSGYSDLKLLFAGFVEPLNVIVNAGIGLYHDPDDVMNQSRVRDASVGVALEAEFDNVFVGNANPADLSKITFALTGRYRRLEEVDANIGVVQVKLNIPITGGMALPLSVTYASRTEFIDESEVRGNFGLTFDLDKLFALGRGAIPSR